MNKEFIVSLDVCSDSVSLREIASALGRSGMSLSHDKDDHSRDGKRFGFSIWSLESTLAKNQAIDDHIGNLAAQYSPSELMCRLPQNCDVEITVGVLYDAQEIVAVGASFNSTSISIASAYHAGILVRCYPSTD
jgi:hypothetical protein